MDLALAYNPAMGAWDLVRDGSDLALDDGLETAVILSLFNDARARAGDAIPDGSSNPRGYWADRMSPRERPDALNDRHGSRLWLLSREKQTDATRMRVQQYGAEALAWLVEDGWAQSVSVTASFPRLGWCVFVIDLTRPDGSKVSYTANVPWGM